MVVAVVEVGKVRVAVGLTRANPVGAADRAARAFARGLGVAIENLPGSGGLAGVRRANAGLMFDQHRQDQTIGISYSESGGRRSAGGRKDDGDSHGPRNRFPRHGHAFLQ